MGTGPPPAAAPRGTAMKKNRIARDFGFVLMMVFGLPLLIALPFLLSGFIGRL